MKQYQARREGGSLAFPRKNQDSHGGSLFKCRNKSTPTKKLLVKFLSLPLWAFCLVRNEMFMQKLSSVRCEQKNYETNKVFMFDSFSLSPPRVESYR
jgi:hypothetical protein